MAVPVNKQTDTIYDILGARLKYPLHVGTPSKELLHRVAFLLADATKARVKRETETSDCLGGFLQYGFPVGETQFLDALAAFLSKEYGSPVKR
jgi:hypothetical protein